LHNVNGHFVPIADNHNLQDRPFAVAPRKAKADLPKAGLAFHSSSPLITLHGAIIAL
jgi:hypothetical protein